MEHGGATARGLGEHERIKDQLKEEGTIRTSKHDIAGIRITYIVPKWIWDSLNAIESDSLREDKESEELFTAGKMSRTDLRTSLRISEAVAKERTAFRQWVSNNAFVERDATASSPVPKQ